MTALAHLLVAEWPIRRRSIAIGLAGSAALLALYLGIISLAQGVDHAVEQLAADAAFVGLIAIGFGTQVALFAELRAVDRHHRGAAAVTAAGTSTSTAAMLACCAHHLADLLPLAGVSGAAVFLDAYQTPLFLIGIAMNVVGIVVIARQLRRARRACAAIGNRAPSPGVRRGLTTSPIGRNSQDSLS